MRIVIDMQGAQATNAKRGIGRYSLAVAQAVARNRGKHEVLLALNGSFQESIEPIRAAFEGVIPQENIRVWYPPQRVSASSPENDWRRNSAERIREAFLAALNPDVVHVSSLFEGMIDDAVTSLGTFVQDIPTAVTLYDVIPYIYRSHYLENPDMERWYLGKLDHLRRADLWLAISQSSASEGKAYLGFPEDSVVNISSGVDPSFRALNIPRDDERALTKKYGISRAFVMYGGGIDHRKNVERLIKAYAILPGPVREKHQLVIVCAVQAETREALRRLSRQAGMADDELVMTGYVPEQDLLALYNICKLFVFPSWHEGFGLPALEAMACGAPVIVANAASLPEVVGREDALFDPYSEKEISAKMEEVLTDEVLLKDLADHGLKRAQAFSWDSVAERAIAAFEKLHQRGRSEKGASMLPGRRPKLAYVSPLPPERSGIADYSAELLPELARHYDIDVIVSQEEVADPYVRACFPVRDASWFAEHWNRYERVMYHFGNSEYHTHMFDLLQRVPGVVVLHDFFLSGIQAHREIHGGEPNVWTRELYASHGYTAVWERLNSPDPADVILRYPCNVSVLQRALGVVTHSRQAMDLARAWYGMKGFDEGAVVPLPRVPPDSINAVSARKALGFDPEDFLVCSFGVLGRIKQNKRLFDVWLASALARDPRCRLVFVGQNDPGKYGRELEDAIKRSGVQDRVTITGWVDAETFHRYLEAVDIAVQLRIQSRGETSAAVLDCMNHGTAVVVNAHGSMAELPRDAVWMLPDDFEDKDLTEALEILWSDAERRSALGARGRDMVRTHHAPRQCADRYMEAIETAYSWSSRGRTGLLESIAALDEPVHSKGDWAGVATAIAKSLPEIQPARQLFVDISELVQRDLGTGIQRVTRSILRELLSHPPSGFRIEPVYATTESDGYHYARRFTLDFLGSRSDILEDDLIEAQQGDLFLGLDLQPHVVPAQLSFLHSMRDRGVGVFFVVYDLLAFSRPEFFVKGAREGHAKWLNAIAQFDGVACISRAVAREFAQWMDDHGPTRLRPLDIKWFHLGADIESAAPTGGAPPEAQRTLDLLSSRPTFLMVGTLEPRKGYVQTLAAFESLWRSGADVNLAIVGREGWLMEEFVRQLGKHAELGKHLFWLQDISDEYLERVYSASTCLIAASEGEGFGLPLIEAAQHGVPIIARDIPVFREVAGGQAHYFDGLEAEDLASAVNGWLALDEQGLAPSSEGMHRLSWRGGAERLLDIIIGMTSGRLGGDDHVVGHCPDPKRHNISI